MITTTRKRRTRDAILAGVGVAAMAGLVWVAQPSLGATGAAKASGVGRLAAAAPSAAGPAASTAGVDLSITLEAVTIPAAVVPDGEDLAGPDGQDLVVNGSLGWRVTITNNGTVTADGVKFGFTEPDAPPGDLESPIGQSLAPGESTLAPGESYETIVATPEGPRTTIATVSSSTPDSDPSNNKATLTQ